MPLSAVEIFSSVREELIGEARNSPGLLADLANLERYIAETYSARSFIELLQNADDAKAGRFLVTRHGEWLICANDGIAFSRQDFYSLCRSASSNKQRGQTIGYRGIGFKSVVGVASSVHLLSGELHTTFSRDLTQICLGIDSPTPLIRIPHPLAIDKSEEVLDFARELKLSGYTTVFILGGLDSDRVQDEFDQFDSDYLLFLRHISEAAVLLPSKRLYLCGRSPLDVATREVSIKGPDRRSTWRIHRVDSCDLAFSLNDGKPVPLNPASAIAHAFLPTLEATGFGIRINADFSTDPSRTRIVYDDWTLKCIGDAAKAIASRISDAILTSKGDREVLACLTPTVDLATLSLQKRSFKTELLTSVKNRLGHLKDAVSLAPAWLNKTDILRISSFLNRQILIPDSTQSAATTAFMHYLGVKALPVQSVLQAAEKVELTQDGCAELIAHCRRNVAAGIGLRQLVDRPIWEGHRHPTLRSSLHTILEKGLALAPDFVESIRVAGVNPTELGDWLKFADLKPGAIAILLPDVEIASLSSFPASATPVSPLLDATSPTQGASFDPLLPKNEASSNVILVADHITSRSLPAWRGAEQYVAQVLEKFGYNVEDKSRQNLGYDLYVEKLSKKHYIEVKLLDYAGQPFVITTNEEAVARECADSYVLALALRGKEGTHLQFISDPVRRLRFVRQCRQWVWECSEYEFAPNQYAKDNYGT